MTHTNNITCEFVPGIGFFAEVDGVEYRSVDNFGWFHSKGEYPDIETQRKLRAAAFATMGRARDCPKSLDNRDTTDPLDPATEASVQRGIDQARRGELHEGPEIPPVDTPPRIVVEGAES